jgi:hypothetical protein
MTGAELKQLLGEAIGRPPASIATLSMSEVSGQQTGPFVQNVSSLGLFSRADWPAANLLLTTAVLAKSVVGPIACPDTSAI